MPQPVMRDRWQSVRAGNSVSGQLIAKFLSDRLEMNRSLMVATFMLIAFHENVSVKHAEKRD